MKKSEYKTIVIDGTTYYTNYNKKYEERQMPEKDDIKKLKSYIPGTIREIFVKPGDKVEKNKVLLILEAMKMRNRLTAKNDGVIKKIHVKSGDNVHKNELLIEFE